MDTFECAFKDVECDADSTLQSVTALVIQIKALQKARVALAAGKQLTYEAPIGQPESSSPRML